MSKNSQAVNPNGKAFEATGQPLSPQLSEDLKQISMEAFSEEDSYQDTWSQYPSYQTGSQPLTVDSNQHAFSTNIQQASRYQSDSVPESTYSPQTHGARRSWREEPSISPMNYNQGALQNHVSPISPMTPGFPLVPDSTGRQLVFEDNVQSTCTPAHGMPQHYEGSLGLPPQTPPRDIYGSFGSAPNSCTYTPFQSPDSEFLVQSPRLIQEQHISALNHGQQENLRKSAVGPIRVAATAGAHPVTVLSVPIPQRTILQRFGELQVSTLYAQKVPLLPCRQGRPISRLHRVLVVDNPEQPDQNPRAIGESQAPNLIIHQDGDAEAHIQNSRTGISQNQAQPTLVFVE
ncbi:MAG: hypothetical protein LQ340_001108 [Diploschistes diacapsis]|nr:MAG: hypothetical protein LQ340_001108 [Diploschistes diacapsis]